MRKYNKINFKKVAIKILEKIKIMDPSDKQRIEREIKISKNVRHNNIIQQYCIIETVNTIYIISEYCSGGELFDYIISRKRLLENESCRIFHQLIAGVEYLHKQKIVHRDLKPENLLFDYKRELKIADFGLSSTYEKYLTTPCGSPCYAAPEMVIGKRYEGSGVDIWSCGIILYTMICGYLPFEDENQQKLFSKIARGNFSIPMYVSGACKDLMKNILNVDPTRRFTFKQIREHPWFRLGSNMITLYPGIHLTENKIPV
jgi:5'-AMP-activated protein kinase catalytic alpha subunit